MKDTSRLAGEEGLEPSSAGIKTRCLNQLGDSPVILHLTDFTASLPEGVSAERIHASVLLTATMNSNLSYVCRILQRKTLLRPTRSYEPFPKARELRTFYQHPR